MREAAETPVAMGMEAMDVVAMAWGCCVCHHSDVAVLSSST